MLLTKEALNKLNWCATLDDESSMRLIYPNSCSIYTIYQPFIRCRPRVVSFYWPTRKYLARLEIGVTSQGLSLVMCLDSWNGSSLYIIQSFGSLGCLIWRHHWMKYGFHSCETVKDWPIDRSCLILFVLGAAGQPLMNVGVGSKRINPGSNDSTFEPLSKPCEKLGPSQQNFKHDNVSDPSFPLNMTETTANHSVWPWSKCFFGTTCFAEVSLQEECVILFACCLRHLLATFCKVSKIEICPNFSVYHPCVHSLQSSISKGMSHSDLVDLSLHHVFHAGGRRSKP